MAQGKMHLVGFLKTGPTSHHHGMWRHPDSDIEDLLRPSRYEHIARVLEQGCFDACFFADFLGLSDHYQGSFEATLGLGGQLSLLDPLLVLPLMARATSHIGLGVTLSSTFYEPYHIARTFATLDHLSNGRVAWNVVTSNSAIEARNFGHEQLPPRDTRYGRADEVLAACHALWQGWEPDVLKMDRESGVFADHTKVRYADFAGQHVSTRGPLSIPRSPQVSPVIMQAGSSEQGRAFAARHAEIVYTILSSKQQMQAFYRDIKTRVEQAGRNPAHCAILPSIDVVLGETESIAREKAEYLESLIHPKLAMGLLSMHLGIDFSRYSPDQPMAEIEPGEGSLGQFEMVRATAAADNLTLAQTARRYGAGAMSPQVVGTPKQVADYLEELFTEQACDGFMLAPTTYPGTFEQFVRGVVPELQRRGLFRTRYSATTLREHLRGQ
ncbi:LLM class flavin-dependent oxidoreductase [Pseudomonas sp. LRF_L74]|uniref:LLM class flavin-dependent oxidoreductase n=1 Tax=Pseudomonas sp. LRF_L74 TaxID=3369422 RepID=UPI003F616414